MCGICGIFRPDRQIIDARRALAMRDIMIPRGPDDCGLVEGPGYVLGHRRLSIIDLSPAGHQPMFGADGRSVVVFNGEIYNYRELRKELEPQGFAFRSSSDTEVLLAGYAAWGLEGLLRKLRGMFAFALLDLARHEIHLARDPFGKKPLFFRWQDGELLFASSARALAAGLSAVPAVDPTAIDDLLWNSFVPGPRSIFCGVEKLLPGHAWSLAASGCSSSLVHWQTDFFAPDVNVPTETWLQRIDELLSAAVRRRFVADVPVGVMLSGGIDSGLVTAVAAREMGAVQTFSVANENPRDDESGLAALVADRYRTEHHVLHVQSTVAEDLPALVAAMGEPMGDSSAANVFSIARLARQHVKVILTGDGGDEGFGGYPSFWLAHKVRALRSLVPESFRPWLGRCVAALRRGPQSMRRANTILRYALAPPADVVGRASWIPPDIRARLYTPAFLEQLRSHEPWEHWRRHFRLANEASLVDQVMQAHLGTVLVDDFLSKVDLATMGASLEARCPFLDVELMSTAMRIPAKVRFLHGRRKGLLRELARRYLPAQVVDGTKRGFTAPIALWFRRDWGDMIHDLILGPHVERRGWFRRAALQHLVDSHRRGADHSPVLWTLVVLELWLRLSAERTPGVVNGA